MAKIIDGKLIAKETRENIKREVETLSKKPGLAVIIVGTDAASQVYVKNKHKACEDAGMKSFNYELDASTSEEGLLSLINVLNNDKEVHGILVQLPLPKHINEEKVINEISPEKDVDCFTKQNVGQMLINADYNKMLPATPKGCIKLIESTGVEIAGRHAVVIGRSNIVGKPVGILLLQKSATVTYTHSKTKNLKEITRQADILVVAIGKTNFVTADMVKAGAIVIDVGMNRCDGKLYGDVDFENVKNVAEYITPVPGGVGPMTIAMLLDNTLKAYKNQEK